MTTTTIDEAVALSRLRALLATGAGRSIRLGSGLSLGEAGRAVGVESSTILRWERLDHQPRGSAGLAYLQLLERLMASPAARKATP
jgi:DNA-binding transcriptional regulator YiaG